MLAVGRMRFSRFVCTTLLFIVPASAQELPLAGGAPVPPALLTAKKIFISNAGADSGLFPHPFSGNPGRAYNQFYATVQNWGRYECVTDPSDADLVFELRLTAPYGPANANKGEGRLGPAAPSGHPRSENALRPVGTDRIDRAGESAEDPRPQL